MAGHGFDEGKLHSNLDRLLGGWVDSGALPCAQAWVFRNGETAYSRAFGWSDLEAKRPLKEDAIFRIYSMTKVFTSVAALALYEEGRFKMHDPLSRYIPEFQHVKVAERDAAGHVQLVPPRREIIIRDLFTMASGIPYPGGSSPSELAVNEVMSRYEADSRQGKEWDTLTYARALAKTPLAFHPGEHWWYGLSIDLLGAVVEAISGQTLGAFMRERIFEPLDLWDTAFYVPPEKTGRFVTMYEIDAKGAFKPAHPRYDAHYFADPASQSGGGGLVSTLRDVSRFARMLLGGGELEGARVLSRKSVELMRVNHLSDQQLKDYDWDTQRGYGYGLGVRVMMRPELAGYGTVGEFAWDGLAGTWFAVDPAERMTAVFLMQTVPGRHDVFPPRLAQAIYGAIAD